MVFWRVVGVALVILGQRSSFCLAVGSGWYINVSVLGDPGMRNPDARFGFEAWNSCNEVGIEVPRMGSPRMADCATLHCSHHQGADNSSRTCNVTQRVQDSDNLLKAGDIFPKGGFNSTTDVDKYAEKKELYLGSLCEVSDSDGTSSFWTIMLKNGNLDKNATFCPENGRKVNQTVTSINFPCFGPGCMNQPLVYRNESRPIFNETTRATLVGGFYGTYNLDANLSSGVDGNISFFSVTWSKNLSTNSWVVGHKLTTSAKYPWLMLYLRADASRGFNGGYHYNGTGIMKTPPESPNFKVRLTLDIKQGGGKSSQFYLLDIGSCWKNNGAPCDGDVLTDVTRYSEMIINNATRSSCSSSNLAACPPYHNNTKGVIIHRNDTSNFPYDAYHYYCAPGNANFLELPNGTCDPYSNPQAQELVQILPHSEWAVHGYPANKGEGWVGDPRTWELDTGALSSRLYFYQDPGTEPAKRVWLSVNVGTEIYKGPPNTTAEWTVSDFDIVVPNQPIKH